MLKYFGLKRNIFFVIIIVVILAASYFYLPSWSTKNTPRPVQGVLDISSWDFAMGRPSLAGEWEFYWNRLYTYADFLTAEEKQKQNVYVPKTWNYYGMDKKELPGFGYATYRLRVVVSDISKPLSLRIDNMSTAYRLFVNEKEIASNGTVGMDQNTSISGYLPIVVSLQPPAKEFEIIVQVSNYTYARGGIWYEIAMGTPEQIDHLNRLILYKDALLTGSLLIMALYYFSFYIVLQKEKSSLYFMLLCLIFVLRTSLYGDMLIMRLIPHLPFEVLIFLTYTTLYWITILIFLMVDSIYPCRIRFPFRKVFLIYGIVGTLITAILPIHIYTAWITGIEVIGIGMVMFSVGIVADACRRREKWAGLILLAAFVIFATGVHDVLYQANIIWNSFGEMASAGIFLFMFVFSFIIASRLSDSYEREKDLSGLLNESLNKEKAATKELIKTELSFLQAQIKPHFLYNSLSVIAALSTQDPKRAKELLYDLSDYLRGSFNFENYDGVTPIASELATVRAYLSIEKARFGEKLQIEYDVDETIQIFIPMLVIQPLVENSVRHGIRKKIEGGRVRISVVSSDTGTVITIEDTGVGIPAWKLPGLLNDGKKRSGVGLLNIEHRLKAYYGNGLEIQSEAGKGTTVTIHIPEESEVTDYEGNSGR